MDATENTAAKPRLPMMNGKSADYTLLGAIMLLGVVILAITYIVVQGHSIPSELSMLATALVGFVVGSRVVPSDVSRRIESGDHGS